MPYRPSRKVVNVKAHTRHKPKRRKKRRSKK